MKKIIFIVLVFFGSSAYAYDGMTSELSHAAGGAAIAAVVTKIADDSPNRAWIGFGVSATLGVLAQGYEMSVQKAKFYPSLLDAGSHALGAALGAWVTDKYFLTPIVSRSYSGVILHRQF